MEIHKDTKGLIFDLDGTLADTMGLHISAWIETGQHFGVNITPLMINTYAGVPTLQLVDILNHEYQWNLDAEQFEKLKDQHYYRIKEAAGKIKPITHVYNLAEEYKGKLPMVVGTGSIRSDALMALKDLKIIDWFEGLVSADDIENPKPHPETFLECAKIIGISPVDCQVFEDGPKGIEAALAAGMKVTNVVTEEIIFP